MRKTVFVIMPFSTNLQWVYEEIIIPACRAINVGVTRADDILHQRNVLRDIVEGLVYSDLIIADLTDNNPNVYYELGAAQALMRPVIILTQSIDSLPFDLRSHRIMKYSNDREKSKDYVARLTTTLQETLKVTIETSSPIAEYFPTPFSARLIQANRHAKPIGEMYLFKNGSDATIIGRGELHLGLTIEPSYPIKTINWGSAVTGWGWDGNDTVSAEYTGQGAFILRDLAPNAMGDIRGTPYVRTTHAELIYFDLYMWKIFPTQAFQKTESGGRYSGILYYPVAFLEQVPKEPIQWLASTS
jgi:hypothetical protein